MGCGANIGCTAAQWIEQHAKVVRKRRFQVDSGLAAKDLLMEVERFDSFYSRSRQDLCHPHEAKLSNMSTPGKFGAERIVGAWIAEKRYFKPGVFPANSTTLKVQDVSHYTQIIWRDTREVGCSTRTGKSEQILVCRYNSPGNVVGKRPI
ncbi:hypothetical protein G7A66_00035 [Altererythrobacter sp. SALINAS58]|uniref:CAP domain-containing protein n=1 Tax=Alteripontixanthobacter muriae TaxID=2705546 RepID=UPI001575C2B1|nr:hypothetical protein [Alteripontixanthobacter muriae]